eukprot:TRINITY_DN23798_c0_g1_i4.p1 TRINITY_DN23798_c0_g1~~TRINITY_DN23798_c0_g1_i4.p1  ORF type:complete len:342 (+),score=70.35 TRINITY_DN23798_c0_g1_i4:84-1028(+)
MGELLLARAGALGPPGGASTAQRCAKGSGELPLFVRLPDTGELIAVAVPADGSVEDCAAAARAAGWPDISGLLYQGQPLRGDDTLADAGLSAECVLEADFGARSALGNLNSPEGWMAHPRITVDPEDPRMLCVPVTAPGGHRLSSYGSFGAVAQYSYCDLDAACWAIELRVEVNTDGGQRRFHTMDERYKCSFVVVHPDINTAAYFTSEAAGIWYDFDGQLRGRAERVVPGSPRNNCIARHLGQERPKHAYRVRLETHPQRKVRVITQQLKGPTGGEEKEEKVTDVTVPPELWPTGACCPFVILNAAADRGVVS